VMRFDKFEVIRNQETLLDIFDNADEGDPKAHAIQDCLMQVDARRGVYCISCSTSIQPRGGAGATIVAYSLDHEDAHVVFFCSDCCAEHDDDATLISAAADAILAAAADAILAGA
jgi:hypothetical protein